MPPIPYDQKSDMTKIRMKNCWQEPKPSLLLASGISVIPSYISGTPALLPLRIEAEQQLLKNGVELGDRWEADNKALTTELGQATLDRVGKLYQQNKGFMNIRIRFK